MSLDEEQIFNAARRFSDSIAQAEYLDEVCAGEPALRERIEDLLSVQQNDGSFLATKHAGQSSSDSADELPQKLGDFELIGELGRGGMGIVYEARQISLNRRVALKVLSNGLGLTAKAVMRFRREAEAAAKLHHTNIVPIYSTGEDKGIHFYAMELIDGPSLDHVIRHMKFNDVPLQIESDVENATSEDLPDWVAETIAFDGQRTGTGSESMSKATSGISGSGVASGTKYFDGVATMIADVAEALDHAHDHGVIHRDIKPSNLLLSSDRRLSVNDFGLARVLEQPGMTMSGEMVGTPRYMSPEQISAGRAPLDHRTDIYSLGATLFELITLHPPFQGNSRDEVIASILYKEPKSPRKYNRRIPSDLETICLKAIERDPDRRYQSAAKLARDLRNFVNRHAISAKRVGPVGKLVRWAQRHPSSAALIVVVMIAILGIGALWESSRRSELASVKDLVLAHSTNGNFDEAERYLRRAKELWAEEGWLELMKGQIELFRGDYDLAREHLGKARELLERNIPTDSLITISYYLEERELKYFEELRRLQDLIEEGWMAPTSADDFLFLGFAHVWADPEQAIDYLDRAAEDRSSGAYLLIRAQANKIAAWEVTDKNQALSHALKAVDDAKLASFAFRDSQVNQAMLVEAHVTVAAKFGELDDLSNRNRHLRLAEGALHAITDTAENKEADHARFRLLQERDSHAEGIEFLKTQKNEQLGNVLRAYRIIGLGLDGELDRAKEDHKAFKSLIPEKKPFLLFAALCAARTESDLDVVREETKQMIADHQESDKGYHLGLEWALCRLLQLPSQADICERRLQQRAERYRGSFVSGIFSTIVDVADGQKTANDILKQVKDSRRQLAYASFGLAIDALADGRFAEADMYLDMCSKEGFWSFYVVHFSRALITMRKRDVKWPFWIEEQRDQDSQVRH